MFFNPNGGSYHLAEIDRIAREVVTEEMIDGAIYASSTGYKGVSVDVDRARRFEDWRQRDRTRRNIAIGIACGSYSGAYAGD